MKKEKIVYLSHRGKSFQYAFEGIHAFFRKEPNAVIHLLATLLVIFLSIIFPVNRTEAIALVLATGFVWATELFNTAIEKMLDFMTAERHPSIKFIKDVAAAAVLVAALTALSTGALVFIPKIALIW